MTKFINITEKRPEYEFIDRKCIGRKCFHAVNKSCYNRQVRGCPDPLPAYSADIARENAKDGWRVSR